MNLNDALDEAFELRTSALIRPDKDDGPTELYDKLLLLRANLDRLDTLLLNALRIQRNSSLVAQLAKEQLEDAWNKVAASAHAQEYSSAKEREALYSVKTLDLKIVARKTEKARAELDFLVEYLKTAHRGMDGARRDLDTLVRARSAALALER